MLLVARRERTQQRAHVASFARHRPQPQQSLKEAERDRDALVLFAEQGQYKLWNHNEGWVNHTPTVWVPLVHTPRMKR